MINETSNQRMKFLLQSMLNQFYGPPLQPQSQFNSQSTLIHLNTVLMLFKSTGNFNPILLQQLRKNFQKRRVGNSQIYVTRGQLIEELCNPNVSEFTGKNPKLTFQLLKNQNNTIDVREIATTQQHKNLLQSKKIKQEIREQDINKIILQHIGNMFMNT